MPRIDRDVEKLVREAYAAVVARDAVRLERAIAAIEESAAANVLALAVAVDAYVVADLFDEPPTSEGLDEMAGDFVSMEDWYPARELPAAEFFRQLGHVEEGSSLPGNEMALLSFLVGGWLLSAFLPENKHWYEYLDEVLDVLDQTPAVSS